jgi:hypothetical protein
LALQISGNTIVKAEKGIYNFTQILLIAKPNYSTKIMLTSTAINSQTYYAELAKRQGRNLDFQAIDVDLSFRPCLPGEVTQNNKCVQCLRGTYSLSPVKTACDRCPERASCPGGAEVVVDQGFWRRSTNSTEIYQCLNDKAC